MNLSEDLPVLKKMRFLQSTRRANYAAASDLHKSILQVHDRNDLLSTEIRRLQSNYDHLDKYNRGDASALRERDDIGKKIAQKQALLNQNKEEIQSMEARQGRIRRIAANAGRVVDIVCRKAGVDEDTLMPVVGR